MKDPVAEPVFVGLELLYRAYRYAVDTDSDSWDFAVETATLEGAGLSKSEFRWLMARGYVEHAEEVSLPTSETREFQQLRKHQFTAKTCFVLRKEGVEFIEGERDRLLSDSDVDNRAIGVSQTTDANNGNPHRQKLRPAWDRQAKELVVGNWIVKRFRWPAPNQELMLDVFQEEGWPRRIYDPLPAVEEQTPRRRLHDTIKCLNRNQENRIVRFRGDGTGEGVTWELLEKPSDQPTVGAAMGNSVSVTRHLGFK